MAFGLILPLSRPSSITLDSFALCEKTVFMMRHSLGHSQPRPDFHGKKCHLFDGIGDVEQTLDNMPRETGEFSEVPGNSSRGGKKG